METGNPLYAEVNCLTKIPRRTNEAKIPRRTNEVAMDSPTAEILIAGPKEIYLAFLSKEQQQSIRKEKSKEESKIGDDGFIHNRLNINSTNEQL